MLAAPSLAALAAFSGRDVATYTTFGAQALAQATLLFSTVTALTDYPTDPDKAQLALNGILDMADRMYLEQPHAAVKASPYNSENIGSYSYSKGMTSYLARAVRKESTGLLWWDLAVEELSQVSRSLVTSDSVGVFDHDLRRDGAGRRVIPGPADLVIPEFLPPGNTAELVPFDEPDLFGAPVEQEP